MAAGTNDSCTAEQTSSSNFEEEDVAAAVSLLEFCANLEDYTPTVPDAVTMHYLQKAGFNSQSPIVVRLVSLAAQKFISDIANDALTHCKVRSSGQSSRKSGKDRRFALTLEDLGAALNDYGITLKKPSYFT